MNKRFSTKGYSLSPRINEGVYQVGRSAMRHLDYTSSPSSWVQSHCIIYPDGKHTPIHIINEETAPALRPQCAMEDEAKAQFNKLFDGSRDI